MGKIVCCWELGEDYGHIGQFFPVITSLAARGHEIYFAVKDLSKLADFDWPSNVTFLQAPLWLDRSKKPVRADCYAGIIVQKGYDSAANLQILVNAWQYLLTSIMPDLLILDHSPTALLASRGSGLPRIIFSNPFVSPPPGSEPINLRPWQSFDVVRAQEVDAHVADVINQVCMALDLPPVSKVSDLFAVEKTILSGFYELDFYRDFRSLAIYGRPLPMGEGLQRPVWSPGMSTKIFAYLKAGRDQVIPILRRLAAMQARVVCFYSGARPEDLAQFRGTSIVVSDNPFDLVQVYREAHAIICHAGMGMVYSTLYHGCPMILLPTQVEQQNTANRLRELGVASVIQKEDTSFELDQKLNDFFSAPVLKENARAFSEKIKAVTSADIVQTLSNLCEDLLDKTDIHNR